MKRKSDIIFPFGIIRITQVSRLSLGLSLTMYIPVARLLVFFCTVYQDLIDRGGISKQINWTLFNLRND